MARGEAGGGVAQEERRGVGEGEGNERAMLYYGIGWPRECGWWFARRRGRAGGKKADSNKNRQVHPVVAVDGQVGGLEGGKEGWVVVKNRGSGEKGTGKKRGVSRAWQCEQRRVFSSLSSSSSIFLFLFPRLRGSIGMLQVVLGLGSRGWEN